MNRDESKVKVVEFLVSINNSDTPISSVDENEGLITAGLIDSIATLEIINFLEEEFDIDLIEAGADPSQIDSISSILDLIANQ